MVQKEISFSDETHIFYREENGKTQRYIKYALTPSDEKRIKANPELRSIIESEVREYNAGKYYYLNVLYGIVLNLNDSQKYQLFTELKELHDKVEPKYDSRIINKGFLSTFGKYWPNNSIQCAAFFTTIYLAMVDMEEGKMLYPNSLGKTMVLRSCEAVLLKGKDPRDAAVMFERKTRETTLDDILVEELDFRYEKYNGYNGYDDDTIDLGFDGFTKATWNVD